MCGSQELSGVMWQNGGPTFGWLAVGHLQRPVPTEWPRQGARAFLNSASINTQQMRLCNCVPWKGFSVMLKLLFWIICVCLIHVSESQGTEDGGYVFITSQFFVSIWLADHQTDCRTVANTSEQTNKAFKQSSTTWKYDWKTWDIHVKHRLAVIWQMVTVDVLCFVFKPPTLLLWSLILMMGSFFLRSHTTALPLGLAEARMCWTCLFQDTTLMSSAGWKEEQKSLKPDC